MAVSHMLRFDNAYARRAENASRYASAAGWFRKKLGRTANRHCAQDSNDRLGPYVRCAATLRMVRKRHFSSDQRRDTYPYIESGEFSEIERFLGKMTYKVGRRKARRDDQEAVDEQRITAERVDQQRASDFCVPFPYEFGLLSKA